MNELDIYTEAISRRDPAERASYLDHACDGDPALRKRIDQLLEHARQVGDFLQEPAVVLNAFAAESMSVSVGAQVGPYALREKIGEGGMGEVYVAEQTEPVKRKVALKVIKPGMDTKQVIARFEAERQTLAMMDHPNIAQVYDGGATESGRPFFVMELVHGVPITELCDEYQLSIEQRLELFVDVCRAIQHAHQQGIMHRDVKPSNVLVALHDDKPTVKVIDFGVAKAIDQELVQQTMHTRFAQVVGTPAYMSPEQAELRPLGIDTRTDVYSLGVLLYELMTGSTPIDKERLDAASYDELRRIVREDEPLRPSARISTMQAGLATTVAERRHTAPVKLSRYLRGELDSIVLKCLEKDRSRRFDTASALADDVQRFLDHEPIVARSPSMAYRFRKFVRRNRVLVASLSSVFVALSLGAAIASVAFLKANQQRDLAERRLTEFIKERGDNRALIKLLREMYPTPWGVQTAGQNYTVYEFIEEISPTLETRFRDHPAVEVTVRQFFADAYTSAGKYDKARDHLQKALARAEMVYDPPHKTLAEIHGKLADEVGSNFDSPLDFNDLLEHAEIAIEMNETLGAEAGRPVLAWFAKGQCLLRISPERAAEAEAAQRRVVEITEGLENNPALALWDLGLVLMDLGDDRLDDAEAEFQRALGFCQGTNLNAMHRSTVLSGLGECLCRKGDIEGATRAFRESWTLCQTEALKNEHRAYRRGCDLVETYFAKGDLQEAFELVRQMELQLATESAPSQSMVEVLFLKGWLHFQLENYPVAAEILRESTELAEERLGKQNAAFGGPCVYLGMALEALGQYHDAEQTFRQVLPLTEAFVERSSSYTTAHWFHTRALNVTAGDDGTRLERALQTAQRGHAFVASWGRQWLEPEFQLEIAELQLKLGQIDRKTAIASLQGALDKAQEPHATYRNIRWRVPTARTELERMLVRLYSAHHSSEEALNVLRDAVSVREAALDPNHIQTALAQLRLGEFLVTRPTQFDIKEAEESLIEAYSKLTPHRELVDPLLHRAAENLAEVYRATGRSQDAAKWKAKAEALR